MGSRKRDQVTEKQIFDETDHQLLKDFSGLVFDELCKDAEEQDPIISYNNKIFNHFFGDTTQSRSHFIQGYKALLVEIEQEQKK